MSINMFDEAPPPRMAQQSTVRTAPPMRQSRAQTPAKPILRYDRQFLRETQYIFTRIVVGGLISYSWITTVSFIFGMVMTVSDSVGAIIAAILCGFIYSVILTSGEFYYSEGPIGAYLFFYLQDVAITVWQTKSAVFYFVGAYQEKANGILNYDIQTMDRSWYYALWIVIIAWGCGVSYYPERIAFGARAKMKKEKGFDHE